MLFNGYKKMRNPSCHWNSTDLTGVTFNRYWISNHAMDTFCFKILHSVN